MNARLCLRCNAPIAVAARSVELKTAIHGDVAAWRAGYCSADCMEGEAFEEATNGLAWWQGTAARDALQRAFEAPAMPVPSSTWNLRPEAAVGPTCSEGFAPYPQGTTCARCVGRNAENVANAMCVGCGEYFCEWCQRVHEADARRQLPTVSP